MERTRVGHSVALGGLARGDSMGDVAEVAPAGVLGYISPGHQPLSVAISVTGLEPTDLAGLGLVVPDVKSEFTIG